MGGENDNNDSGFSLKDYGFGSDANEADTANFTSEATGGKPGEAEAEDKGPRDDGSDNAGWDAASDTKDLSGVGKEPEKTTPDEEKDEPEKKDEKKPDEKGKDDDDADDEKDDGKGDDELPDGVKRRLSRAQRQRDREKEDRIRVEAENAELRKKLAEKEKPAETTEAPKAEDFDDYEDFLQAKDAFEKKAKEPEKKTEPEKPADKPDRELVNAVTELKAVLTEAGHAAIFQSIVDAGEKVPVPRDVVLALTDPDVFEHPETVLQALLDDPDNAVKLAEMSPARRMKQLVALDKPMKAKEADKTPARRQSSAPDPIGNTNGNTGQVTDYATMDFDKFEERRNAEAARRKDFW